VTFTDPGDARSRAQATLAALAAMQVEIDEALAVSAVDDAEREARFAADARVGKLGVEWQRVQQRIDLGETTVDDVMSGADDSPAARALRERAQTQLSGLHEELVIEEEDPTALDDPLTQMNQLQSDLVARLEELRIRTEEWDGRR
jgi:hypothetical protein